MTPFRRIISRTSPSSVSFHVIAFIAVALASTNAGATTPPPVDALDAANAALTAAATPDGDRYAPDELAAAHRHLDSARAAMAKRDYKEARALAEEAQADADLARAKSHMLAARADIDARIQDNAELQHRLLDQEPLQQEQSAQDPMPQQRNRREPTPQDQEQPNQEQRDPEQQDPEQQEPPGQQDPIRQGPAQ
jgi:hypothetical protein